MVSIECVVISAAICQENNYMPYVNLQITTSATREQKAQLGKKQSLSFAERVDEPISLPKGRDSKFKNTSQMNAIAIQQYSQSTKMRSPKISI